jgi:hypothetical protein
LKVSEAVIFVKAEIAKLEAANRGTELRPWIRDACPAAVEHWGRLQQRIALGNPRPHNALCCADLNLEFERTEAELVAQAVSGARLASARRSKTVQEGAFS